MTGDIPRIHREIPDPQTASLADFMDVVAAAANPTELVQEEIARARERGQRLVNEFVETMNDRGIAPVAIRDLKGRERFGGWVVANELYRWHRQVQPPVIVTTARALFKGPVQDAPEDYEYQPMDTASAGLDLMLAAGALRHLSRYSGRRTY